MECRPAYDAPVPDGGGALRVEQAPAIQVHRSHDPSHMEYSPQRPRLGAALLRDGQVLPAPVTQVHPDDQGVFEGHGYWGPLARQGQEWGGPLLHQLWGKGLAWCLVSSIAAAPNFLQIFNIIDGRSIVKDLSSGCGYCLLCWSCFFLLPTFLHLLLFHVLFLLHLLLLPSIFFLPSLSFCPQSNSNSSFPSSCEEFGIFLICLYNPHELTLLIFSQGLNTRSKNAKAICSNPVTAPMSFGKTWVYIRLPPPLNGTQ